MKGFARVVLAALTVLAAGYVHGSWTNRWGTSTALVNLAQRFEALPSTVGPWSGDAVEMGPRELNEAGAVASYARSFRRAGDRSDVLVLLLAGLPGEITVHTPDICYPGSGFELGPASRITIQAGSPPRTETFWTAVARSQGLIAARSVRLFWAWTEHGAWQASDNPRWSFASAPALCKLYVVREFSGAEEIAADDPSVALLTDLIPLVDRALFPPPSSPRLPR